MAGLLLDQGVPARASARTQHHRAEQLGSPVPRWPPGICARSRTSSRAPV